MDDVLSEIKGPILFITFNRIDKHNAFDNTFLAKVQHRLDEAETNPAIRVIVLKANGPHFSAGADLAWMQRMVHFSEEENSADAAVLANVLYSLYYHPKPTLAMIQGAAFGGGAGIVAACDIAIAADTARFCFSEVKLGLLPAIISPYVIRAMGERAALHFFTSADPFDAKQALALQLIQHCVLESDLLPYTLTLAERIASHAPQAVYETKRLVRQVATLPIDEPLQQLTASLIAKKRVSSEGQYGLQAFLNKEVPNWND